MAEFEVERSEVPAALPADYNVAPTKDVYAVVARPPREDRQAAPVRQLRVARWGLVPAWARDPGIGSRLVNARVETVRDKPAFRRAVTSRRALVPADGYYEWYAPAPAPAPGSRRAVKQPWYIAARDGGVLAFAGLYEVWRDPARDADDPAAWLLTVAILTTEAEDCIGHLHDRMPLLVAREDYGRWLDPAIGPGDLSALLVPAAPGRLVAHPVSPAVGDVRNNGPELVAPIVPAEHAVLF